MTVKVYPDAEGAARSWLRSLVSLLSLGVKTNFSFNNTADVPQVVVRQVAGAPDVGESPFYISRLQHDCWAAKKADARLIADTLVGEAESLKSGAAMGTGAVALGASCVMGPLWSPDPVDQRPRYIVDIQYTLRAA